MGVLFLILSFSNWKEIGASVYDATADIHKSAIYRM